MKSFLFVFLWCFSSFGQTTQLTYQYTDDNDFTCESHLFLKGKESLFIIKDPRMEKNNENSSGTIYKLYNDKWSRIFYSSEQQNLTRIPLYGKEFVYQSGQLVTAKKLTGKTKKIAGYACQEILVTKGGRKYSVWYTTDVPLVAAPLNLAVAPGLVVEVRDLDSQHFKVTLQKISKSANLKEFESYKNYILSKTAKTYPVYEKELIQLMSFGKRENYAALAKLNASIEYSEDHRYFTVHVVDIPVKLVPTLQKITK